MGIFAESVVDPTSTDCTSLVVEKDLLNLKWKRFPIAALDRDPSLRLYLLTDNVLLAIRIDSYACVT